MLVPVLGLLYFLYLRWRRTAAKRIGDKELVAEITRNHSPQKALLKFLLLAVAFALGCIALANPRRPDDESAEVRKGIDVVLSLIHI